MIELAMAIGHAEFHARLGGVLGRAPATRSPAEAELVEANRAVRFRLGPERVRSLGSLRIPETRVRIELEGYAEAEVAAFLERFLAGFRRAGG